jgi:hypothetical protein
LLERGSNRGRALIHPTDVLMSEAELLLGRKVDFTRCLDGRSRGAEETCFGTEHAPGTRCGDAEDA